MTCPFTHRMNLPRSYSHMGITAINPERGDVDRIVNVLKEVISAATSKR
jgi:hypothetical protein